MPSESSRAATVPAVQYAKEIAAGATAGIVGTILGYPLDTLKTNMQTRQEGLLAVIRSIYSREGLVGFYRGVGAPLTALTVLNTLNFSSYATFCSLLQLPSSPEGARHGFEWRYGLAGACAGPMAAIISTPFEMVKTQQQLRRTGSAVHGSLQTARHLLRQHGLSAFFVGHLVNTAREILFLSTYFTVYEHAKLVLSSSLPAMQVAIPLAGGLAGAVGWFVSFPLDSIKSNIQGSSLLEGGRIQRQRSLQVFRGIIASKGLLGLYTGVAPSILRAFIVSASRFSAYEAMMAAMD